MKIGDTVEIRRKGYQGNIIRSEIIIDRLRAVGMWDDKISQVIDSEEMGKGQVLNINPQMIVTVQLPLGMYDIPMSWLTNVKQKITGHHLTTIFKNV